MFFDDNNVIEIDFTFIFNYNYVFILIWLNYFSQEFFTQEKKSKQVYVLSK